MNEKDYLTIFDLLEINYPVDIKESYTPHSKEGKSYVNEDDFFRSSSLDYFRSSSFSGARFNELEKDNGSHKMTSKFNFQSKDFEILSSLGSGAYAEVYKAKHKVTNVVYSIKVIDKRNVEKENKLYQIFVENELLNFCNHPNIINIYGSYEDKDNACLVEEYCPKGDLAEFIIHNAPLSKEEVQFLLGQIVCCLEYLANIEIIHRDIKPENFIIDPQFKLKLIDFGTSTFKGKVLDEDTYQFVDENKYLYEFPGSESCNGLTLVKEQRISVESRKDHSNLSATVPIGWKGIESPFLKSGNFKHSEIIKKQKFVGTAEYMSPEIINNQAIGEYTDIWSLACIIMQMFTGISPFRDKTEYLIFQKILSMNYNQDKIDSIPKDAHNLIFSLLKLNPTERYCYDETHGFLFSEFKQHPFFRVSPSYNIKEIIKSLLRKSNYALKKAEESTKAKCVFEINSSINSLEDSEISYSVNKESFSTVEEGGDSIIKTGMLKKRSPYFYYDLRKVILLSTPRIDYIDPESFETKGTILLDKECQAELVKNNQFLLKTPKRVYSFMCKEKYDITPWVKAINKAISKYGI